MQVDRLGGQRSGGTATATAHGATGAPAEPDPDPDRAAPPGGA